MLAGQHYYRCVRNFHKNEDYIVYKDSTKRIDELLADFAEQLKEFDRELAGGMELVAYNFFYLPT